MIQISKCFCNKMNIKEKAEQTSNIVCFAESLDFVQLLYLYDLILY